jgi:DNA-binding response OmpR family regulator
VARHHEQSIYAAHQYLLVADDADLRQEVRDYLAAGGYNVIETCMFKENVNVLKIHAFPHLADGG